MLNRSGLVVLEGLDGSGKSTQFEMLSAYFSENGIKYKAISFPDYDNPSSALVKMYLNGEIGKTPADVNAYAASSFYAVDRYACYKQFWEHDYKEYDLTEILTDDELAKIGEENIIYYTTADKTCIPIAVDLTNTKVKTDTDLTLESPCYGVVVSAKNPENAIAFIRYAFDL